MCFTCCRVSFLPLLFSLGRRFRLRSCIIIGQLDPDVSRIFPFEVQLTPLITLSATWNDNFCKVDPRFSNQVCLFVVIKHGAFQLVIIERVVDGESEFLVPIASQKYSRPCFQYSHTIVVSVRLFCRYLSFWLLSPVSWHSKDLVCPSFFGLAGSLPCRRQQQECLSQDHRASCRQRCLPYGRHCSLLIWWPSWVERGCLPACGVPFRAAGAQPESKPRVQHSKFRVGDVVTLRRHGDTTW